MDIFIILFASATGCLISAILACIPGLHVYNTISVAVIAVHSLAGANVSLPPAFVAPFALSMIVAYAMLSTIPSVLLAAPDESAFFTVLPGQKYLMQGRGYEGTVITAAGGLTGLLVLVIAVGCLAPVVLAPVRSALQPHYHSILWCVIFFLLMSEWPMEGRLGQSGWSRFRSAWAPLLAGLLTFLLSGLLGFLLMYRSPLPAGSAITNLMPAFIGLFTMPWLFMNVAGNVCPPRQEMTVSGDLDATTLLKGTLAGSLGGGFAAFFPAVTGGIGGFLAGHATGQRDDRIFLVSQGASKMLYYVGGSLFLFVPGLHMTRGSGSRMLQSLYRPETWQDYHMALASIAIAGVLSFLLVRPLTRGVLNIITRFGYRRISVASLFLMIALVLAMTGLVGLGITFVASAIGLIPVLYGSRRMNCLGIILLPIACGLSGIGGRVAALLGLA